jgi:hypothetical protein
VSDDVTVALGLLTEDRDKILYRPQLAKLLGVTSAILLQQVVYRWDKNGRQPFYKFKQPCGHKLYQEGDSWCEELAFTRREFDTALGRIATRKSATMTLDQAMQEGQPVVYWTDRGRVTHYTVNVSALMDVLRQAYPLKAESAFSKSAKAPPAKGANGLYQKPGSASTNTETTTENDDADGPPSADGPPAAADWNLDQTRAFWSLRYVGVDEDVAQALAQAHDPEAAESWCCVAWARHGPGGVTNPAGFVRSKLEAGAAAPGVAPAQMADFRRWVADYRAAQAGLFESEISK